MGKYSVLMSIYQKTEIGPFRQSVDSMLHQTVAPDEFIIVLDGPIGTELKTVLDEYCQSYPGLFTVVSLPENHGLAYALNAGLKVARNELIARMDSDDISINTRCEKQLELFEKNANLALVGTDTKRFTDDPNAAEPSPKSHPKTMDEIKKMIRRSSPFGHPTVMFKLSAVANCGYYDPELRRSQDLDLFSKMIHAGYEATNIQEPLLLYRIDEGYTKRNQSKETCKARIVIQKRLLKRGDCGVVDFIYIWGAMIIARYATTGMYVFLHNLAVKRK